ncbi:hypothetical protein [uncultured Pedobacter sp.]|uniref:hypothetical protein n=1 Tax=uncultured Pedobacter sp. TaxID=246139 RepID=UPI0025CBB58D|nr:hypothetical protein [uncultured Pedobacter sp.]
MDEANALLLVESLVNGIADSAIRMHYSTALTKVKAVLKTGRKEKLETLPQHFKLTIPQNLNFNSEYLSIIQHAIAEKHLIIMP